MKPAASPSTAAVWPPLLLVGGLLACVGLGLWQQRANEAAVRQELAQTAERTAERLRRRMQLCENGLLATRSAVITAGSSVAEITHEQFHRYGRSLDLPRQFPGLSGVSFIRRVPVAQEAAFVAGMRREGFSDFRIRQVGPNAGERFVIQYMEPGNNPTVLGLDVASDPARRGAALASMRSGEPRLSAPFAPEDDPAQHLHTFALMVPVYRDIATPAPALREADTVGWANVRLLLDEVLRDFDREGGAFALALADATPPGAPVRFFTSPDWTEPAAGEPQQQVTLQLYGRTWQVELRALAPLVQRLRLRDPLALALRGGAVAALLSLLLHVVLHSAQQRRAAQARIAELNATLEQQVGRRTAELRAILDSAASAIIATDMESRVIAFNPAAEAMLGLSAEQALGRSMLDFHEPAELLERVHLLPVEMRGQASALPPQPTPPGTAALAGERNEWTYVRADGTRFPGLLSLSPLRDDLGQPHGFLAVIVDLSERKTLERALEQRTLQAEAASQAKSAFLAHMSHEFHTPLNAVIGLSQLLGKMDLPAKAHEFAQLIWQAGDELLALTDDVLDLSHLQAGELRLDAQLFEPAALLDDVLAYMSPLAAQKGLQLRWDIAAELPPQLRGDPLRLKQVLLKLLGNAVKFTGQGSVSLRVAVAAREPGRVRLLMEVSDTGPGIEPQARQRIFDAFAQGDASSTRRFGGTGSGLPIVRHLVALMGGELTLHSDPGQGSRFGVAVDLEEPALDAG
ncbi:sensor histidine kinase [Azohydromonas lata]|uniref:sensor histidine kinase n=1 Tax=Azohydromonas lata TaxID=45677 RepID=UPI0008311B4D|nr:CHASE domain-containing protein [Azohydromonas lata]